MLFAAAAAVPCRQGQFSLRASLFLSEILKERGMFRELTQLFIKMTAEVCHRVGGGALHA